MAQLDPYAASTLSTNPSLAAYQQQQSGFQRTQAETQQEQLRNQQQQDLNKFSGDMGNYLTAPDSRGKAFHELPTSSQQGILRSYPTITQHIPEYWNAAQRAATGNQDIGVPKVPEGTIESRTVSPEGHITRSYQADTTPTGNAGPTGEAEGESALQGLPNLEQQTARQIASYQFPYNALQRMPPLQRMRILNAVSQYDPDFDANQYQARQGVLKSFASGPDAANIASANTVIGHISEMLKAGQALNNRSFTPWNAVANTVESATGNPAQTRFLSASTAVADELAKLFKGTGAATDQTIKDWKATLSPNMSPEQLKASAEEAMSLMASRLDALREKYSSGMGKAPNRPFIGPKAAAVLRQSGLQNPEENAIPAQPQAQQTTNQPQLSERDQQFINWARANPDNPKARQILSIHGIK